MTTGIRPIYINIVKCHTKNIYYSFKVIFNCFKNEIKQQNSKVAQPQKYTDSLESRIYI